MNQYDQLFDEYVAALTKAKQLSENWWNVLLSEQIKISKDIHTATKALKQRWPFGPASHPWVIAVFREYYLRCEDLNNKSDDIPSDDSNSPPEETDWGIEDEPIAQTTIPPRTLVIDNLATDETEELYDFILNLLFLPIGQKGEQLC